MSRLLLQLHFLLPVPPCSYKQKHVLINQTAHYSQKYPHLLQLSFNHPKLSKSCLFYKDFPDSPSQKRSPLATLPTRPPIPGQSTMGGDVTQRQYSGSDWSSHLILLFTRYVTLSKELNLSDPWGLHQ